MTPSPEWIEPVLLGALGLLAVGNLQLLRRVKRLEDPGTDPDEPTRVERLHAGYQQKITTLQRQLMEHSHTQDGSARLALPIRDTARASAK